MIIIELKGYDQWKTSPPEPKPLTRCDWCHDDLYQYEEVWFDKAKNKIICESCKDEYINEELDFVKRELEISDICDVD